MAREKVNKAAKIREAFDKLGHDARPKDIVAALAAQKIKVAPAQVSMQKAKLGKNRVTVSGDVNIDDLLAAKKLIQATGSFEKARAALDAMGKFLS